MPKHVRSIECCYCGASTLVNLQEADGNSLKCGECGAAMSVNKMEYVSTSAAPESKPERRLSEQWEEKREWRGDDRKERSKPKKKKKKKGFFDRLEDIWDDVEDIFD